MTKNLYYLLDLKEDVELIQRYRDWHAPGAIPPPVIKSIRDAGIEAMEIFLVGNRLLMVLTPGPEFDGATTAGNPDVLDWETQMWHFQQPLPFANPGEKWVALERIFTLSEQF